MTTDQERDARLTQLTREESKVDEKEPWIDDKLKRQQAADALANLIKAQRGPFVIALDGDSPRYRAECRPRHDTLSYWPLRRTPVSRTSPLNHTGLGRTSCTSLQSIQTTTFRHTSKIGATTI